MALSWFEVSKVFLCVLEMKMVLVSFGSRIDLLSFAWRCSWYQWRFVFQCSARFSAWKSLNKFRRLLHCGHSGYFVCMCWIIWTRSRCFPERARHLERWVLQRALESHGHSERSAVRTVGAVGTVPGVPGVGAAVIGRYRGGEGECALGWCERGRTDREGEGRSDRSSACACCLSACTHSHRLERSARSAQRPQRRVRRMEMHEQEQLSRVQQTAASTERGHLSGSAQVHGYGPIGVININNQGACR